MLNVNNLNATAKLLNQTGLLNNSKLSAKDAQAAVSIFSSLNSTSTTSVNTKDYLANSIFAAQQDGEDDGKLTFGETAKSLLKGAVKTVAGGIACAALIAVTGGAATPFIIAGGAILGGVQVGKGLYNASQATTDDAKRAALEDIGSGTATIAMSVAAGKAYSNATGSSLTSLSTYKDAATNSINNANAFMKLSPSAAKAEIASVTSLDKSVNWMSDDKALNQMYEADAQGTMKKFGYQLAEGFTKNNEEIQKKRNIFAA